MTVEGLQDLPRTRPLYRREYEALGQQGFFADADVELLDGRVVFAAEEGGQHAAASLVIEVAHSSRSTDLGLKAALDAAAGITDYWVVDLTREEIVVHREPSGPTFAAVTRHREGVVRALHHPRVAVDVRALFR